MRKISVLLLATTFAFALGGCAPAQMINMTPQTSLDPSFVVDATRSDSYPANALGEGNIYSCRFGVHFYVHSEFVPPKAIMFAQILAKANPDIGQKKVTLQRFDVYKNWRLQLLSRAGSGMGAVGAVIASNADQKNNPTTSLAPFHLEENPGDGHSEKTENQIGCDGASEGEYYPSQINGGSDVIVIWLQFTVDGQHYSYRSTYGFHFDTPGGAEEAAKTAIDLTITQIAKRI